jgi:hypothetical protein
LAQIWVARFGVAQRFSAAINALLCSAALAAAVTFVICAEEYVTCPLFFSREAAQE